MMVMRLIVLLTALVLGGASWAQSDGERVDLGDVARCWMIDPSSGAARVTVKVAFSLDDDGMVVGDVRQVSAVGGDVAAEEIAFQSARRAVIRCGSRGYAVPTGQAGPPFDVEIKFTPSGIQLF